MITDLRLPLEFNIDSEHITLKIVEEIIQSQKKDTINLYCAGYGGDVIYANLIINSIIRSSGKVNVIVDGQSSSCHANIALCKFIPTLEIAPIGVVFMLHDTQLGLAVDGTHNTHEIALNYKKESTKYYQDLGILDLLTPKEKKAFVHNKNIYFDKDEAERRIALRSASSKHRSI